MASLVMLALFMALLLLRVPACVAMGFGAVAGLWHLGLPLETLPRYMQEEVRSIPLLAIPFFILAATIMFELGLTRRIFNFANHLVGFMHGGLAQVNIVSSIVFAGISGSALADIAGLGSIQIQEMTRRGYRVEFAAAITVASSVIAPIIPPSIMFIIYAVNMNVSIAALFVAGLIPGILIGLVLMVTVWILAVTGLETCPVTQRSSWREIGRAALDGLPAILSPVIILAGMVGGVVTPTEAAVMAVIYSLLLGLLYREITLQRLYAALDSSIRTTALIMFLTGIGSVMAFVLTSERTAETVAVQLLGLSDERWVLLILINVAILVLGCFLETLPALLISIPIFGPLAIQLGMDPLQFGVVLTLNLLIGIITPPIGLGLFAVCAITGLRLERVIAATSIFLPVLLFALLLLTFIPALSTWLPSVFFRD